MAEDYYIKIEEGLEKAEWLARRYTDGENSTSKTIVEVKKNLEKYKIQMENKISELKSRLEAKVEK